MKLKNIGFVIFFLFSIIFATFIVDKFDKYEVSSDTKSNHVMIKGDAYKYWSEAALIKKKIENGTSFNNLGSLYYHSFLPSKLISAFYVFTSEDMFLNEIINGDKLKVNSDNKKNYFFYLQIIFFYISLLILLKSLKKNNFEISTICIFFLILEPTINQYHYSFFTESFFFSLLIILLSQIINNSNNNLNAFLIGFIVGLMYLQRSVAILYFLPVLFFFILEKKNLKFYFSYLFGFLIILSFLGLHNFQRSGIAYFTPYQSKQDLLIYLIPNVEKEKNDKVIVSEVKRIKNEMATFKLKKDLNLSLEKDLLIYGSQLRNLSIDYVLENPFDTLKVMIKKSLHASVLNPFEIYSFYKYEYKAKNHKFRYYKSEEHQKNIKYRILYSVIFYLVCVIGAYAMFKKKKSINFIAFLLISILYFTIITGWVGNPRYLTPNIIFLSIFFAYGFFELKRKVLINFKL